MPRTERSQKFLIDPLAVTRDPIRRAMGLAAQAAYDNLWLESWLEKEPGVLPADDRVLARLAQVSDSTWRTLKSQVETGFKVSTDVWICSAVLSTLDLQDRWRTKWRNDKRRKRKRKVDITHVSKVESTDGSGSGSGAGSGTGSEKKKTGDGFEGEIPDWLPKNVWSDFVRFRVGKKKPLTQRAGELILKKLGKMRDHGSDPVAALEQSIMGDWTGVFEAKAATNGHAPEKNLWVDLPNARDLK